MRTEDGQIIHKCLNGDTAAFGLLVDKYKASIYALAYSKLHNFHDAEDVTQEAFIKAFRKLRTLRWWDNFLAWLYAITSNLCKDWIRSQSKRPDREFLADQDYSVLAHRSMDSYQVGLMRESLHDALNSLPEKYRQVLTLHYLGGMTRSEIARFLGISPRTITQRLMEGRARLREEMIAMMSDTYEQQRLTETFTFRIVEMIKRIKIQPVPRISWLPWGLSFAAGVILAILNLTSSFALLDSVYVSPVILTEGQSRPQFHRLEADEAPFASYNQKVEILAYMNMAATSEAISGGNERSQTAEPVGSSEDGQGADETRQPEQLLLAAAPQAAVSDAAEKITIAGKVVKDNSPVPDARVFVYSWDTGFQQYTNSKSDGSFQLEMTKPERWDRMNAIAQHPQYSFGWTKLSEDNTANVIIKLHNPVAITGTVVDESGHPIQGAEAQTSIVSLPVAGDPRGDYVNGDAIDSCTVKTDSQGNFAIRNLPEGANTNFVIIAPGFAMIRRFNVRAGTADLMFSLKPEGRIEGYVTFDETGEPVPGAVVYIRPADFAVNVWAESRTDENGRYALTNLPAGEYHVFLKEIPPDWAAEVAEYIKVAEGQVVKNIGLQLTRDELITGRITDKATNEPIKNHWIGLSRHNSYLSDTHTDENGVYQLRSAPGKVTVYTSAPNGYEDVGQLQKEVEVAKGEIVSGVDFQFSKGEHLSITGRTLSLDGEPVAGVVITDWEAGYKQYAVSDKDGSFTIKGLRPGQKLSVRAEQRELQLRGDADLEAQPGVEAEILMEEYKTTSVSGQVVNKRGEPVPSANIGLLTRDRKIMWRSTGTSAGMANSSGEYKVTGLIVGDEYSISASADGYRDASTKTFTAAEDMPPLGDILLSPRGNYSLEGKVTDTDGYTVARARVTAMSEQETAYTDENGYYRLDSLPFAVEVEITIDHSDYGYSRFWYVPTNQAQDFVLVKADGYLSGKVVDVDGNPVEKASVRVDRDDDGEASGHVNVGDRTNVDGTFSLKNLLVDETESIYVGKGKIYKIFHDVKMNQDDVVFVLEESTEPPKPPTPEEMAGREYSRNTWERSEKMPGTTAPELDVAQWLNGEPAMEGKNILLHFWLSQDVRSLESISLINVLQREYGDKGLVCVGIHEATENIDDLRKLMEEKRIEYPVAIDKQSPVAGAAGSTLDRYAVFRFPTFIVIDKEGLIHAQTIGSGRGLEEKVRELVMD